ncbi:DUF1232 domain-containing protein [Horticoccus sp. 23ND18S-11]|uniref:DUF1232 domain-containing protein n=1 Tax=Horticoccus sp. 23ND18S-11 TaxID=3391832 RepID=UPI0039C9F61F
MTTKNTSIPETLNRHLSAVSHDDIASVARYIDLGAGLVTPDAINALRRLGRSLDKKVAGLGDSERLRRRIELLATYFEEACVDGQMGSPAHRDVAFALLYFLKGFDRIPDNIPEVGLLDDAMVVQIVLQRHASTLRAHWLRQRRVWPAEF